MCWENECTAFETAWPGHAGRNSGDRPGGVHQLERELQPVRVKVIEHVDPPGGNVGDGLVAQAGSPDRHRRARLIHRRLHHEVVQQRGRLEVTGHLRWTVGAWPWRACVT